MFNLNLWAFGPAATLTPFHSKRIVLIVDADPGEVCRASLSLFLSIRRDIPLPLPAPPPLLPCFQGREGELPLPEADCSSLNNSCRLPAVLSSVLHHSITPLHKDIQMGWDARSHKTLTDTLKQACAHLHVNLHAFTTHMVKKISVSAHASELIYTNTQASISQERLCRGLLLSQARKWQGRLPFSFLFPPCLQEVKNLLDCLLLSFCFPNAAALSSSFSLQ